MGDFAYQATNPSGEPVSGIITAETRDAAYADLRRQGLKPRALDPVTRSRSSGKRLPLTAQLSWAERMATLLNAGLPIDRALSMTAEAEATDPMVPVAQSMLDQVRAGQTLSDAARNSGAFRPAITGILAASERTGDIPGAFRTIAQMLEKSLDLRRTILLALTYPAILAIAAIGSVLLMLGFIVPQFESLIGTGDRVPRMAQMVLAASQGLRANAGIIAALCLAAVIGGIFAARSPRFATVLERFGLSLPFVGPVLRDLNIATLFQNLGTFTGSGVPLLESIELAANTVPEGRFRQSMHTARAHVAEGGQLSAHLSASGHYPMTSIDMLRAGEESAAMDRMMLSLAQSHESAARAAIKRYLTLLEPLLILLIGLMIGGIVFSIFQAILSINDVVL